MKAKGRQDENAPPQVHFPIVGIGASAGGLSAFEAFFSGMPAAGPGMAFVLVQHLAPDYKSILASLIQRFTPMRVFEAADGMIIKANTVYVIPPNFDMALLNGALHLLPPATPHGQRLPIDFFFRSLAQDQQEKAICIVLSGTGSDGTLGVREVKGEGGMVMVQQPESAEYDGMPRSAIATGLMDYILPPAEMPAKLLLYASHLCKKKVKKIVHPSPPRGDVYNKIFILLRDQVGHDFSEYKTNTVIRRVERRMLVHQIERLEEYVLFLQKNPLEAQALFRDLLIGVTSFFRDPEAFAALATYIGPRLFAGRPADAPIRVWVPACSSGEEAYSLAILLQEQMEELKRYFTVQIFATDIDSRSIETARCGLYPASIAGDVSRDRLARFFTLQADGGTYRINKVIRDMLVFSEQNLIKDPPFSRLDLVSCRNLLIYMNGALQKKLIPLFHYALNPGGLLFLGTSESVGDCRDLFTPLDRKAKLYFSKKNGAQGEQRLVLRKFIKPLPAQALPRDTGLTDAQRLLTRQELTERVLLHCYSPASVLVSKNGEILYIHGRTGKYLEMAAGDIGVNILKMAREGLRRDLTTALHTAVTHKEPVFRSGLRVKTNGDFSRVNLTVHPVAPGSAEGCDASDPQGAHSVTELKTGRQVTADPFQYLVVLEEVQAAEGASAGRADIANSLEPTDTQDSQALITALRQELQAKEEYLQSTTEELQSSNEELETSKEELQSINEELTTVNAELQNKVFELQRANNDMNNLLAGTGVGTVFVDKQLLIQRFTPAATQLINLIPTDVGRPVGHTVTNLVNYNSLEEDAKSVLNSLAPMEIEVQTKSGAWFLMCIRPYRTQENVAEGVVINFVEISKMVAAQESLRRLAVVVNDSHDAVTLQDLQGRILAWNNAAQRMYGWSEPEALAMNIRELIPANRRKEALEKLHQLIRAETLEPYQDQRLTKDGQRLAVWITATALLNKTGHVYAIATTERHHGLKYPD
ncbi:MAG: PAS domain-containing protein [Deltaproteobacteria bacterium]|nr:PAS domain-containing protein [Deltaproteobacteria bacterium]